jgi:Na+/melibiose symporter-like transporter
MATEPPSDDPRNIWQSQPPENPQMTPLMSLEEIHRKKAKKLRTMTRFAAIGAPVVLILFGLLVAMVGRNLISQIAGALAILWTLIANLPAVRRAWSHTPAGDAAMLSGLEFYRTELRYRLTQFRRVWITFLIPIILALAGLALPIILAPTIKALPFLILLAIWFAIYFPVTRRQVEQLQLELDELDALERWQRDER